MGAVVELKPCVPLTVAVALLALVNTPACAQPAHHRVGPSYLYPTAATPSSGRKPKIV